MNKPYDLIVYIGRFQPVHKGHLEVIKQAQSLSDNLLVLVGSKNSPRTPKNPWTYDERQWMLNVLMSMNGIEYIGVAGIRDHVYDDNAWIAEVGATVNNYAKERDAKKIAIIGHDKDHSSFYLNYFKQWDFIEAPGFPSDGASIDATKIRQLLFTGHKTFVKSVVPKAIYEYFTSSTIWDTPFLKSDEFALLQQEWDYIQGYEAEWGKGPFITADGLIIQSGHILLIERGEFPGNGLYAMPGGFVNPTERIRAAFLRESREETKVKVPLMVIDRAVDAYEMFDDPGRSLRGRIVTHVYRATLDPAQDLPKIKGASDAKKAIWIPLGDFEGMENVMFEDHYYIIKHMLSQPAREVR